MLPFLNKSLLITTGGMLHTYKSIPSTSYLRLNVFIFVSAITERTTFCLLTVAKPVLSCFFRYKSHWLQLNVKLLVFVGTITEGLCKITSDYNQYLLVQYLNYLSFAVATRTPTVRLSFLTQKFERFFVIDFAKLLLVNG